MTEDQKVERVKIHAPNTRSYPSIFLSRAPKSHPLYICSRHVYCTTCHQARRAIALTPSQYFSSLCHTRQKSFTLISLDTFGPVGERAWVRGWKRPS